MMRFRVQPEPVPGMLNAEGVPDLTIVDKSLFKEVKPEDAELGVEPENQRSQGGASGTSAFKGPDGFETYVDANGDRMPFSGLSWTQTYQYRGPGIDGSLDDLAIWTILRSGMGDGGEAVAGQAESQDTLNFTSATEATAATPARWRTGDNGVAYIGRKVFPFHVSEKAGADLKLAIGLGEVPDGAVAAHIYRTLFEEPETDLLGLANLWYADSHDGRYAWAMLRVRSKVRSVTRDDGGRALIEVQHTAGQIVPRHSDNDGKQGQDCGCGKGRVAKFNAVPLAIASEHCGEGGALTQAPHSSDRINPTPGLRSMNFAISGLEAQQIRDFTAEVPVQAIDFEKQGEATLELGFSAATGRETSFDLDIGRDAKRPVCIASKPVGPGNGLLIFMGSAGPDTDPNGATPDGGRMQQGLTFKVDEYCGDKLDGTEAPNANRAVQIAFGR